MPSDIPFREFQKFLKSHGWTLERKRGSHHIFKKSGSPTFSIPVHRGHVKAGYFQRAKKIIAAQKQQKKDGSTD